MVRQSHQTYIYSALHSEGYTWYQLIGAGHLVQCPAHSKGTNDSASPPYWDLIAEFIRPGGISLGVICDGSCVSVAVAGLPSHQRSLGRQTRNTILITSSGPRATGWQLGLIACALLGDSSLQQEELGSAKALELFKMLADAIGRHEEHEQDNFTVDTALFTSALNQMSALQESLHNTGSPLLNPGVFRNTPSARLQLHAALIERLSADQFDDPKILALMVRGIRPELLVAKTVWGLTTHSRAKEIAFEDTQSKAHIESSTSTDTPQNYEEARWTVRRSADGKGALERALMPQEHDIEIILQKKTNALGAKHLHQRRLGPLEQGTLLIDFLAVTVPILYVPVRYLAKGTGWQELAESLWEILAALLAALTIFKLIYGWQEQIKKHSKLRDDNISLVTQADSLLRHTGTLNVQSLELFLSLADRTEEADRDALGILKDKERQWAYREALKEMNAVCRKCHASPWDKPGACPVCGNTPSAEDVVNARENR